MSELTRIFEHGLELSAALTPETPRLVKISFDVIYLGNLLEGDSTTIGLIPVEILDDRAELGWLYAAHALVVFHNFHHYAIRRADLKEYCEPIFKTRQFSDTPKINHMQRIGKKVIGWIDSGSIPHEMLHKL